MDDILSDLRQYLQQSRDGLVGALDGLGDYDIRRPLVPSGTNLLGLIKHLTSIELSYLGDCVGRPAPFTLPWVEDGTIWDGADMWALPNQSREYLVGLYRDAWQHSDVSFEELHVDSPATVEWWPEERRETTFGHLVARVVDETARHAGHADIVREMIDGRGGRDHDDMGDEEWWKDYVDRIEEAARSAEVDGI